ncbi:MAG: hypothetical protein AB7O98_09630 [Hyphomonadaceae bacterium]
MMKYALAAAALISLGACGTQMGDRMASGAAIGGGIGLAAGGVGAVPGAIIGAGVGAFTPPENMNLGEPVWDDSSGDQYYDDGNPKP